MFVDKIGVLVDDLGYDLVVSTPGIAVLTTNVCVRDIIMVIERSILSTNFTLLAMREYDAIFSMDWMTKHRALIDCQKKKVLLFLKWNVKFIFQGRRRDRSGSLISYQRAQRLIDRGCKVFLATVVATIEQ